MGSANAPTAGALKSLFYHVALPAKLPQASDNNLGEIESAILDRLVAAAKLLGEIQDGDCGQVWDSIGRSLQTCMAPHGHRRLERGELTSQFRELRDSELLILHIARQNAGILIHKPVGPEFRDHILFETFEASPKREAVLAAQTLAWKFPGTAVLVPSSVFYDDAFLDNLTTFLEQASVESTQKFSEYITKAGRSVAEDRETPDPALITSLLTAILEANGKRISPKPLRKRVRDDVCWLNCASPWRRLPFWLVIRVALARYLATMLGESHGRMQYKFLMCIMHTAVLNDTRDIIDLEEEAFLKAKLCRRLYKLDRDHLGQPQVVQESYTSLIRVLTPQFDKAIVITSTRIGSAWDNEKYKMTKDILSLPRKARPEDRSLSLELSRPYLKKARARFRDPIQQKLRPTQMDFQPSKPDIQASGRKLIKLFDEERRIHDSLSNVSISLSAQIQQQHDSILDYIDQVGSHYDSNAEQKSIMLLTLMEAWKSLDEAACAMFPLLYEFNPIFTPRLMEALRLPLVSDITRARMVQGYIQTRVKRSGEKWATVFDNPCKGCFAERYFNESPGSSVLTALFEEIQSASAQLREEKEEEWKELSAEYGRLTKEFDSATCTTVQSSDWSHPTHDARFCPKCRLDQKRSRMVIKAFESPLPESIVMAKAVVFELRCPEAFAAYRDATWAILYRVARETQEPGIKPMISIREYSGLQRYAQARGSITLASKVKSFLMTHYKERKYFPVDLDQVCLPNALKLAYFDKATGSWPRLKHDGPTFEHHCRLVLPRSSPFSSLIESPRFNVYGSGPSSYEIAASYSSCPSSLTTHEHMAFQFLLSGTRRRWITILTELGSSNLNLSTETTVLLFDHLANHMGPFENHQEHQDLGTIHYIFRDASFCDALLQQLRARLDVIASNWRETHLMEIVIMLALRLVALTMPFTDTNYWTGMAMNILSEARQVTLRWVRMLRDEMYCADDVKHAQNCQSYLLWAALLCKRTFACHQMTTEQLEDDGLSTLIECSATIYDNIPDKFSSLDKMMRNYFIRDLRMMYNLRHEIGQSIKRNGGRQILIALQSLWPAAESKLIHSVTCGNENWIRIRLDDPRGGTEVVGYNYIFGILLVDGQPIGRLPTDPKSTIILRELFGTQTSLMKFPSNSPGMSHVLAFTKEGYQIHIGYDGESTIIRAIRGAQVLELIPRDKFYNEDSFDLPAHLIFDCVHWLDLVTGILEIRPKSRNIWCSDRFNWKLDETTSTCSRFARGVKLKEILVDPRCPLFNQVSNIFSGFERPMHLTIYQPSGRFSLTVEMPRMQLKWFVNQNRLLQSSHLQAEIDPHQDIGTWYGFESKLVCRSLKDSLDRFVLVPFGELLAIKRGCHTRVRVHLRNTASAAYVRFKINKMLGRIDCAAEPALVYKMAEIYALTSFLLPDPLTGLTGVESSLAILTSRISQPWSPLSPVPGDILGCISKLSPQREYYPEGKRVMKKETWADELPTRIQREEFRILAGRTISKSTELANFYPQKPEIVGLSPSDDTHLSLRALHRRQLYERRSNYALQLDAPEDVAYEARHDPCVTNLRYSNALEIVSIIRDKSAAMSTVGDLAWNLSQSLSIKGYGESFNQIALHDRLNVDVRHEWGPLVNAVKDMQCQYRLMFFLGVTAFRSNPNMPLIRALVAFAHWDDLQALVLPDHAEYYNFRPAQIPQANLLMKFIEPFKTPLPEDPPLIEYASGKEKRKLRESNMAHTQKADADSKRLVQSLISEWPALFPSAEHFDGSYLIDIPAALDQLRPEWQRLCRNHEFYTHLRAVQEILDRRHSTVKFQRPEFVPSELAFSIQQSSYKLPSLGHDLMRMSVPRVSVNPNFENTRTQPRPSLPGVNTREASRELEQIIEIFSESASSIKQKYSDDLKESLAAFDARSSQVSSPFRLVTVKKVPQLQGIFEGAFAEIESAIKQPSDTCSSRQIHWLQQGQLWPAVTPITILEQLRSIAENSLGNEMKESLFRFALSITELQKQIRMQSYLKSGESSRYEEEQVNIGHSNWRVQDYPDWLLLEIDSNILIRETQVEVALAIIAPESGANSVLQLNMGQGKTSCIIPMVAVLLADGKNLVRVSVPKPLLQQTAQLLHGRLGGLVGREISHVPFSRRTPTGEHHIKLFHGIHRGIQESCGVMLCLPEQQMSFMLSGLQRVLDQRIPEASMMIRVQKWLNYCARDVLDESDHTLAVKTQLIYPSGSQMAVDGHPNRWLVAEKILGLVDMHLYELAVSFPYSIEVVRREQQGFPFVFFLRPDVEEELINRLRYDVCQGARGIIPVDTLDLADQLAIKEFLSGGKVRQSSLDRISSLCPDRPHVKQTIYLLRGLFVHRILIMALKKRFGVQYGLHPSRDPVAVPFHAKGVPSEQSEFGHIDVAILLTALAFYYTGISRQQTSQALEAVLKSDDPASEYDKWTEDEDFPDYLRDWHSINVDDSHQIGQIWNCVRFKVPVIDYFMNNFVFPPHAKQFRVRLQSNGWDIPLFAGTQPKTSSNKTPLDKSRRLTTGFSGTNDIKPLLPLTIKQDDLPSLSHTNAEVLTYLLQPRSRQYVVMADDNGKRLTENSFLKILKNHNLRVLIDSGAQILEQSNRELAESWLQIDGRAEAALFFDGDSPWILSKLGTKIPLLASPYVDNLSDVLVYLDEAHTRGTDLKFGPFARAALTLGLGQTKDHTVQAAMRLRQLGTTQSVTFFAPAEVNQSIRDLCGKKDSQGVDSYDVIRWLINNTCDGIEELQPLYYSHGTDFCSRIQAAEDFPDFLTNDEHRAAYTNAIKHKERQTLQQLYGAKTKAKSNTTLKSNPKVENFVKELEARKKAFQDTGQAVHASALREVEQERETENEVETVRQVKKPLVYAPHKFPGLQTDLETFARTGKIPAGSDIFVHVLKALSRTTLGKKYKVNHEISTSQLFVSREFERTVKLVVESANDNFMRPVQWILYAASPEIAVIVTPEEAELLIRIIQEAQSSKNPSPTHLMTYAAPVTRRMMRFNKLGYYAMPPLLKDQQPSEQLRTELGFFAGRLYFDWSEYHSICRMLDIDAYTPGMNEIDSSETDMTDKCTSSVADSCSEVASHRSDEPRDVNKIPQSSVRPLGGKRAVLTSKPYTFTQEFLAARRHGQDFSHTPMGFICSGKPLNEDSPFFRRADATRSNKSLVPVGLPHADDADEEAVEELDLGNYDPSAEIRDDEDDTVIEYDKSEVNQREEGRNSR
ncbi:hypothetical protein F4677DRAFT_449941 [Hypoxylon crocopeplum]|nr:hypothetical protein F4677DRAFT_449941 [Hypoxylon crocopeplum]